MQLHMVLKALPLCVKQGHLPLPAATPSCRYPCLPLPLTAAAPDCCCPCPPLPETAARSPGPLQGLGARGLHRGTSVQPLRNV